LETLLTQLASSQTGTGHKAELHRIFQTGLDSKQGCPYNPVIAEEHSASGHCTPSNRLKSNANLRLVWWVSKDFGIHENGC
jgi:hypothetical protein